MRIILIIAITVLATTGCATPGPRPPAAGNQSVCSPDRPFAEGAERATLWMMTSAEYRSATEVIYGAALQALRQGLADPSWSAEPSQGGELSELPPAVVLDIDETVLDNTAAEARMMLQPTCPQDFPAVWDAWLAERAAPAIPGAAEFIRTARTLEDSRGRRVRVFLITNRECAARAGQSGDCPQQADTTANLRALGLDSPMLEDELMLKGEQPGWDSEKLPRRRLIARQYRIVLNVGDDLGDFLPDVRRLSPASREQARCRHRDWWGKRWFLVPNPMYGSWLRALGPDLEAALAGPPLPPEC